jgi:hypothetical protein
MFRVSVPSWVTPESVRSSVEGVSGLMETIDPWLTEKSLVSRL